MLRHIQRSLGSRLFCYELSNGRPRHRSEDNIKMDLREAGWGRGIDWIDLAQDRGRWRDLVNAVINLRGSIKCGEVFE